MIRIEVEYEKKIGNINIDGLDFKYNLSEKDMSDFFMVDCNFILRNLEKIESRDMIDLFFRLHNMYKRSFNNLF